MTVDRQNALLEEARLEESAVVANCAMNRDRQLSGVNSYARELGFDPADAITSLLARAGDAAPGAVAWLDLCCGPPAGRTAAGGGVRLQRPSSSAHLHRTPDTGLPVHLHRG